MDPKVVAIFVGTGAVMGLFVSPRVVGYLGAALFGIAILGLAVSASMGQENWTFLFGVGAMAVPVIAGMAFVGSIGGAWIRRTLRRGEYDGQERRRKEHDS